MSKIIVVVGATGIQGSSVADTFLNLPGWKVRGITRDPSSPAAQALATSGVDIVKGDLDDKQTLLPAFEGATAIFANTDFFGLMVAALMSPELAGSRSANEYAYDRELEQNLNIAEAAASPAVLKTLERFIFSSLAGSTKWSGGKITHSYHNDVKESAINIIKTKYSDLAGRMSMLQVGHYVRNWVTSPALQPKKSPDGTYVFQRPWGADVQMPFIVTHKDTGPFVKALVLDLPAGKHVLGVSEQMTQPTFAKVWGETLGVKTAFKQVSIDEFFAGLPEAFKLELGNAFAFVEEFGYTGGDPEVLTADELGVEIPVTSMAEYIRSEDWSSVM